jgi:Tat protein translocase TatB subunit
MFDIGFSELLLIAVGGIVVIGPKDLPVVVRHVAKFLRELRGLYAGIKTQMHGLMDESGLNDIKQEVTTIIDLDGKAQTAYDVRELAALQKPVADTKPSE